jgi:type IV pilus assembly protein PilX
MLAAHKTLRGPRHTALPPAARQRGVVLMLTLIVLVAMTLAAIALVRSVNTTNVIAGNLAFRQSTTVAGDIGTEKAIAWLENNTGLLGYDQPGGGYHAQFQYFPPGTSNWEDYWNLRATAVPPYSFTDTAGDTVSYMIERMCQGTGPSLVCINQPVYTKENGCKTAGCTNPPPTTKTYYRITTRIEGPRNTVSYTQAYIRL